MSVGQYAGERPVEVTLFGGAKVLCASRDDAELVLAVNEVFHSGNGDKKVPRGAIAAMERAGMGGSRLHRSAMRRGEEA